MLTEIIYKKKMISYVIIGFFITIVVIWYFFRIKNSPYYRIRKIIEKDLKQANLSYDWEHRQEIQLKLLWLDTIREIETTDLIGRKKDEPESSILSKIDETKLRVPVRWKLDDIYQTLFIQKILSDFGKILEYNYLDYKGIYMPNNTLPYPKHIIYKAIYYMYDYLNVSNPLYLIKEKDKYADNLSVIDVVLSNQFINTGNEDLPKSSHDNIQEGNKYLEKQPKADEENSLRLIDWLDEIQWLKKGIYYADREEFNDAIICIEMAKEINPVNEDTRIYEGLLYHFMAEYYYKQENRELELFYMKKSAEFGNKTALEWLRVNK